jgi:hypothetical protein
VVVVGEEEAIGESVIQQGRELEDKFQFVYTHLMNRERISKRCEGYKRGSWRVGKKEIWCERLMTLGEKGEHSKI